MPYLLKSISHYQATFPRPNNRTFYSNASEIKYCDKEKCFPNFTIVCWLEATTKKSKQNKTRNALKANATIVSVTSLQATLARNLISVMCKSRLHGMRLACLRVIIGV